MRVLKSPVAASDWESLLKRTRSVVRHERQPGHETKQEIIKRLKICRKTFHKLLIAAGSRLERGQMTKIRSDGRPVPIATYRLR